MKLAVVGPASPGAQAQLFFALLITALFSSLCLLDVPPPIHAVTFDSIFGLNADGVVDVGAEPPLWVQPAPLDRGRAVRGEPRRLVASGGTRHVVAVNPAGTILFDGCAVDAVTLRTRVDLLEAAGTGWLDLRPDPEAPWEAVDQLLATFARAHVDRFRFDNRSFGGAIDARGAIKPRAFAAPRNCVPDPPPVDGNGGDGA